MISFFEIWVSIKYLLPKTREKFLSIITVFSFLGISLGVATLIIVMSVMNGFREELTSKILGVNGHLKIQQINNFKINENNSINLLLNEKNSAISINEVLVSQALISKNTSSSGVFLKGVKANYFTSREIFKNINKQSIENFRKNKGIFIGYKLMKKLNLRAGDYINILSSKNLDTIFGNIPRSVNLKVIGFFDTGMYEYDSSLIFIPLKVMQSFLNVSNSFDFYEVHLDNFDDLDVWKTKIKNSITSSYRISDWRQLNPSLFNALM